MFEYFPTKLAFGSAFCNRQQQLQRLAHNIENANPTLLISPRRYGKTSLALRAFTLAKLPYVHIDLYKSYNESDIERYILNGIGELLGSLEKTPKKLISLAADFFASLQIDVAIGHSGLKLDFNKQKKPPVDTILEALKRLDLLAKQRKTKIILYLDEFQMVGVVSPNYIIEAAIREVAQKSQHIVFIFSGSDRHLIEQMFTDQKRPFYNLCDTIYLERISEQDYEKHLQKAAKACWKKVLPKEVLTQIFYLTQCHSYYINKLCSLLWSGEFPDVARVQCVWDDYVAENKSAVERELSLLTQNHRKLLQVVATAGTVSELYSSAFIAESGLSSSSVSRAVTFLLQKDYLHVDKNNHQYSVLDPLIKSIMTD